MTACQVTWNGRRRLWEWLDPVTQGLNFDTKKYRMVKRATECVQGYADEAGIKFLLSVFTREGSLERELLIKPRKET